MNALMLIAILLQSPVWSQTGAGSVSGLIRTADGKPAANVRVAAMAADDSTTPNGSALLGITTSDESGNYRIENIPPGRYFIIAGRVNFPTLYPGVDQITDATAISITAGVVIREINFTVSEASTRLAAPAFGTLTGIIFADGPPSSPYAQIPGRLVSESGGVFVALPNGIVVNARSGADRGGDSTSAMVRPDGGFSFDFNISSGEKRISVNLPAGYSVKSMSVDSIDLLTQPLTLAPNTPYGPIQIIVGAPPLKKIRGRVVQQSTGAPLSGANVILSDSRGIKFQMRTSQEGSFEFLGAVPGSYFLDVALPFYIFERQTIDMEDQDMNLVLQTVQP